jgi:hypothetical protein
MQRFINAASKNREAAFFVLFVPIIYKRDKEDRLS